MIDAYPSRPGVFVCGKGAGVSLDSMVTEVGLSARIWHVAALQLGWTNMLRVENNRQQWQLPATTEARLSRWE